MKKFILLYVLFLALFFALFYADTSVVSRLINEVQQNITLHILNVFLEPGQLKGIDIWINPHYKIIITKACNGMIPILFLWAAIAAYPARLRHKLLWITVGYILFSLVNIFRILLVVHFVEQKGGATNFHWSHDFLGNMILLGVGLFLFVAFIKTSATKKP